MFKQGMYKRAILSGSVFLAVGLSGCSSDSNDDSAVAEGAPVGVQDTGLGEVLAGDNGLTLYTFNNDQNGVSNCNDGCASNWPPLFAEDDALEQAPYSVISRADGTRQWARDGWPLYYWQGDSEAADVTGEGVGDVWFVAQPIPVSKRLNSVSTAGVDNSVTVLTDEERMSLYVFNNDRTVTDGSACNGGCATNWPPLLADSSDEPSGGFSLVTRDDGSSQWAYLGMPLYRWINDAAIGDTTGESVGGVWYVAQAAPFSKFETAAQGVVVTDSQWQTTYTLSAETPENLICSGACLAAWPPVLADEGDIARGDYSIFTNSDAQLQWAYKDKPVYLWSGDSEPGDTEGQGLAHPSGSTWTVTAP